MFDGAVLKLRDAGAAIDRVKALVTVPMYSNVQIISGPTGLRGNLAGTNDPVAFAEAFSSCVAQVRSIGDAVLKDREANQQDGFKDWRESKRKECEQDDLLRFINDKRNADLHEGYSPLVFTMNIFSFNTTTDGAAPSAAAILVVNGTGPYWIVDQGTVHERRLPVTSVGDVSFTVALAEPPASHLGGCLSSTEPVAILCLAEGYYRDLLFEARKRFTP